MSPVRLMLVWMLCNALALAVLLGPVALGIGAPALAQ